MADLGSAYVQIVPSAQGIGGQISNLIGGEASSAGMSAGSVMGENILSSVSGIIGGGASVITGAVSEVVQLASATASTGDTINKQSQKIGISNKAYQEWSFILQHCGTDIGTMQRAMKTMTSDVDKNSSSFAALGLSMDEVKNMSQEDMFSAVISGLQQMPEGVERNELANKLLGRSCQELQPLLNTTNEETQGMKDTLSELGGVMSDEAVANSAEFEDRLLDMNTAFDGVKNSLGSVFIPLLADGMEAVAKFVGGLKLGDAFKKIEPYVSQFGVYFQQAFDLVNQAIDIAMPYIQTALQNIIVIVQQVWSAIQPAISGVQSALMTLWDAISPVFKSIGEAIKNVFNYSSAATGQAKIASTIANVLKSVLSGLSGALKVIATVIKTVISVFTTIIKTIGNVITKFTQFKSKVSSAVSSVLSTVKSKFNSMKSAITTPINAGINTAKSAFESFKRTISGPVRFLSGLKLPTITWTEKTALGKTFKIPTGIIWNAEGGIFNSAKIIGYGVGEAGSEAIVPLDPFWDRLDKSLNERTEAVKNYFTINMNINGADDPEAWGDELVRTIQRKVRMA